MNACRTLVLALVLALTAAAHAQSAPAPPPNLVIVDPRIVTSGQPSTA